MLVKTEGIVLHTIRHTDTGIIAHILTRDHGRLSFMVRGIHSKKGATRNVFFQPLQILSMEMYYREGRNLNSIREVSASHTMKSIPFDSHKNSMALFISEVLYRSLNETEPNISLYNYIRDSIIYFDITLSPLSNFHIGFLVGLARYLGIAPAAESWDMPVLFDISNGTFCSSPPLHGSFMNQHHTSLLLMFLGSSIEECESISLAGRDRTSFLGSLISFYSYHLPGIKKIKSLEVLTQLFA